MDVLVSKIIETENNANLVFKERGKIYTFLNPVSYLDAVKHAELFVQFDGVFADGNMLVKAIKLFYNKDVAKREFDMSSMARLLFHYASANNKSVYIIASKQEEIEKAIWKIKNKYPNLRIVGYRSGFFKDSQEYDDAISEIINVVPDYLIVGMGIVKQEMFLLKIRNAGFDGIGFTCGAFISQTSNYAAGIDYFPGWAVRFNVRFLYRMLKEPHTRKRYFKAGLVFPYRFICNKYRR